MVASLLIVGYGNPLMGDDGAGVRVAERLVELGVPDGVRVVGGETDSLNLRGCWQGEPEVWLVDAVWSEAQDADAEPPGTLREVEHDELLTIPQRHATAHQLSLPESLRWLRLTYPEMSRVRFRLWGLVAEQLEPGRGLTLSVAQAVEATARAMITALPNRAILPTWPSPP